MFQELNIGDGAVNIIGFLSSGTYVLEKNKEKKKRKVVITIWCITAITREVQGSLGVQGLNTWTTE